jgi:hypothetical protein
MIICYWKRNGCVFVLFISLLEKIDRTNAYFYWFIYAWFFFGSDGLPKGKRVHLHQ